VLADGGFEELLLPSKKSSTGVLERIVALLKAVCRYGPWLASMVADTELADRGVVLRLRDLRISRWAFPFPFVFEVAIVLSVALKRVLAMDAGLNCRLICSRALLPRSRDSLPIC
jgi:hypothetical protein